MSLSERGKKIIWISDLILDLHIHKTSQIEILRHLAERGYDVYLCAIRSKKKFQIENSSINIFSFPLRYVPVIQVFFFTIILFFFLPIYVLIKRPRFIITEPGPSILAFVCKPLLSSFLGLKVILDIRSTPVELGGLRGSLTAFWFNISVVIAKKMFDGITIITPLMKKDICKKFHINSKFVGVWTSGVSTTLFNPEEYIEKGIELRKKIGLNDKFVIFYHGAFSFHRGIIECINGIELLKGKLHNLVLFLLGSRREFPIFEGLVHKEWFQDKVIIHAPVDYMDVPKYIAMCDVGVVPLPDLPDWRHQCPLSLLEYLAMGKVVIATDIPANREVIGKSKCGIYVSSANPKQIAKAIICAHDNRERLKEWGSHGRTIINEKYSWRRVAEDLENYLLARV